MSATVEVTEMPDDRAASPAPAESLPSDHPTGPGALTSLVNGPVGDAVAAVVFTATVVAAFWFIHRYAVNVFYWDQWSDVDVLRHAHSGTLTFGTLWAQHNENRILFPNLVVLALAATTHLNVVVEDYLSGLLWCATTALLIVAHKRRSRSVPWLYYCPVALVMLSFIPLGDALFGFNLSWYLVMAGLAATLFWLDRPRLTRLVYAAAVVAAVIGSFSSLQGLLIWPAGVVLLLFRRRSRRMLAAWIGLAAVAVVVYFIGFNFAAAGSSGSALSQPLTTVEFFFSVIGNVIGNQINPAPNVVNWPPLLLGVLICAIAAWGVIRTLRSDRPGGSPVGVALICFGVLFAASTSVGRFQLGLQSTSRYSIFVLTLWVGAYLALLGPRAPWTATEWQVLLARVDRLMGIRREEPSGPSDTLPTPPWGKLLNRVARSVLVVLMALQLVLATSHGLVFERSWHDQELAMAEVEANIDRAPDSLISATLGGYSPAFVRSMARFARADRLGFYDSALYPQDRRQGIPGSLLTRIGAPRNRAVLSGTVFVNCFAYGPYRRIVVQFRLTGGSLHGKVVAIGHPTALGWLATWRTSSVPNGTYQLRSAIVERGHPDAESLPVTVVVANRS
jgi:hypothetical protein